jgi:putative DNA primase/helicase
MMESWLGREDPELESRIRPELPQIILWALQGLERLRKRKRFIQPESARQHIDELMAMTSPVKMFIEECCETGPTKWIETNTLYNAWVEWCDEKGERPGTSQVFGRNLRAALPFITFSQPRNSDEVSRAKTARLRIYNGICRSILPN